MLVDKYPDGYDDDYIISFRNAKNGIIEAVEVTTNGTKYLIKMSTKFVATMANYDKDDYEVEDDEIAFQSSKDIEV